MSSISDDSVTSLSPIAIILQKFPDEILEIFSSAFLITTNTIGPSIMVIPGAMAGPGIAISSIAMTGVWGVNLLSALLIAEVAINQYEASSCDVPSSFKDFAEINLQSKIGGLFVSFLCIFVNWCVVSFNLIQMGEIVVSNIQTCSDGILDISNVPHATAVNYAATIGTVGFTALVGTQTNRYLSGVASLCCLGLLTTFASILLPGLASVQSNPLTEMAYISSPSGSLENDIFGSLPIFVSVLTFQNMVPTVVKMLSYDRKKCVFALSMGSIVPLFMQLSFSYAVLGGGIDMNLGTGGPLLKLFSTVSVLGSTMACVMSLAGEFDSHLDVEINNSMINFEGTTTVVSPATSALDSKQQEESDDIASIPALTLAVFPPLLAGLIFSGGKEFVDAISISGSYASPLLYGIIPMILAWNQRNSGGSKRRGFDRNWNLPQEGQSTALSPMKATSISQSTTSLGTGRRKGDENIRNGTQEIAPGGSLSLAVLGLVSVLLISQNLITDLARIV